MGFKKKRVFSRALEMQREMVAEGAGSRGNKRRGGKETQN
jgi:hypothetical protein